MIKKIIFITCMSTIYTTQSYAMDASSQRIDFQLPPVKVEWPERNVPIEFTVSPSTLMALAGTWGLYQTVNLVTEGIKKVSDPVEEKQAEGKRILTYSGFLFCGSLLAILGKIIYK